MINSDLLAFITVVQTGSFTAAADKLQSSKARVSQQVSSLEKQLNCRLLNRTTRKIGLTQVGETYYQECCRAYHILHNAKQQISEQQDSLAGHIRLNSVGGIFAEQLLGPALSQFMAQYPQISIELDLSSQKVDVVSENFDLVIRMGQLANASFVARPLMTMATHIVASPAYLAQPLTHPKQLVNYNCLHGSIKLWRLVHASGVEEEVSVNGQLQVSNGHMICQMVEQGLGIARLNSLYTLPLLKQGRLVQVFKDWQVPQQPVSLIYPQARYQSRRFKLLVDFLVSYFEAMTRDEKYAIQPS
ncbi:LysR family transcriptional regulator (plasmid) [Saccharobesus litoralis]|uniref:LysR family transcriptional regulator n=1 Tax=Saccharobesus litoralis TaxID=2172099 RepID=A0A2S0VY82_9ALTE|nr:LysR family transcriptional regulator [Saccharobesus litoralis]AWB69132.1 LysR family transcriptional regulator [Saccharobesus litoralis]